MTTVFKMRCNGEKSFNLKKHPENFLMGFPCREGYLIEEGDLSAYGSSYKFLTAIFIPKNNVISIEHIDVDEVTTGRFLSRSKNKINYLSL